MSSTAYRIAAGALFVGALVAPALPTPLAAQESTGRILGRVTEAGNRASVAGAQVFLPGLERGAVTADEGRFALDRVPAGTHAVRVMMLGYADGVATITVVTAETALLAIPLEPQAVQIEALTVAAERRTGSSVALNLERRDASIVQDAIGQDQIERSADGDAAAVVARSPGVTVVGGKYVYVRGLGDRYGNATLNGAPLASPEPDRKTVPLDLIPASFLESIVTAKTYSPEQPGDYAGGLVQLRTRGYPVFGLLRITGSAGWDSEATFVEGLSHAGGGPDPFALDDGGRGLPDAIARDVEVRPGAYTPEQLEEIGEAFTPAWGPGPRSLPANRSLGVTVGDRWLLGYDERPLGFLATGTWSTGFRNRRNEIERVFASGGGAEPEVDYLGQASTHSVGLGGMLQLAYEPLDRHRLSATTIFNRSTDDQARSLDGFVLDANANLRNHRLQYLAQSLLSAQLRGQHTLASLGGAQLDWRADFRTAGRYEPNTREVLYVQGGDGVYRWENFIQSGSIFHQDLDETGRGGALDVTVPLSLAATDFALRLGASADLRERDVYTRRFRFLPQAPIDAATRELEPDLLFSATHIAPDSFQIQEATFAGDNYSAAQSITAGYAMLDFEVLRRLSVSGGARVERASQDVYPVDLFGTWAAPLRSARLRNTDVLPALNLTWSVTDAMNLRLGASQTLARPQFRELAPFGYADYAGGHLVRGNPILERSTIRNWDARWEWFPSASGVVAVSGFLKHFDRPIEVLVFQQGAELARTWVNATAASNRGVELELRSDLGFLADALATVALNGNLTLVRSAVRADDAVEVSLPEVGTLAFDIAGTERALQGQSPYAINLGAAWTHPEWGTSASVLFNRFGERIESVGVRPLPEIYEAARNSLDVVVQQPLGAWSVKFAAERLIGGAVEFTQGGDLLRSWNPGRLFTLSVSWGGGE